MGKEPDHVRFRRFSDNVMKAMDTLNTQVVPMYNSQGNRKYARDVAGALKFIENYIIEQDLAQKFDSIYVVFASTMIKLTKKYNWGHLLGIFHEEYTINRLPLHGGKV